MKKIVFVTEAYPVDYILDKIDKENEDVAVTIFITGLHELYQLFQVLNEKVFNNRLDLIYYPPYSANWRKINGIKRWLYLPIDILRERYHLKQFYDTYFMQLENATVMFLSPGYTGEKIYVLKKLRKKNRLVCPDPSPPYSRYSPQSLRDIATLLIYKLVYGKDTQLGQYPVVNPISKCFPIFSGKFMKKSVDIPNDWPEDAEKFKDFSLEKYKIFDTGDIKVIYFHQDLVDVYVSDRDIFKRELNNIFKVLLQHFTEKEIARKYHPGHENNKDVIEVGEELPSYIPAQFLHNKKVQIYLSICSGAIYNIQYGHSIALLELISFTDENLKKQIKDIMTNASRSQILFPSSLEEFERILIAIIKQQE